MAVGGGAYRPGMGYWKRHQRKDLEAVLEEFDRMGWRIESTKKYYKLLCPCGQHKRWFHLTPSGTNYGRDALSWARATCSGRKVEVR